MNYSLESFISYCDNIVMEEMNDINQIKNVQDILRLMKTIKYNHTGRYKSAKDVLSTKSGDCHDQSELESKLLSKLGIPHGKLFMVEYISWNKPGGATHTLVWYKENNKYYWLEHAWKSLQGIHGPYSSIKELKNDVANKWDWSGQNDKLYMSTVKGVKPGMDLGEYVEHCTPEKEPTIYYKRNER